MGGGERERAEYLSKKGRGLTAIMVEGQGSRSALCPSFCAGNFDLVSAPVMQNPKQKN
jgi:hypothetical protein